MIGYPGNGEHPKAYLVCNVTTQSRGRVKVKVMGDAYWSGRRWVGVNGFRIGYSKVIKWESKND